MWAAERALLVSEFSCQGHLVTALYTLNLKDINILGDKASNAVVPARLRVS